MALELRSKMSTRHQSIAAQMKTELEEPLAAFAGGMKERRKIVQNGIEKLLKVKVQQTQHVNKTRDRYEQECLKIKGYLAQGHMVMGQEERRNKAKLEKTQISVATSNTEYENAVKALEDTTVRWNREWKAAADKFQDLEEERLDFTKSSLWQFANIASTVCVSDDSSCEKIRLSLEKMDVEQDVYTFIKERGTGQEIPDAPKYINFCRGDINDNQSEVSVEDERYSVAQFPRDINPAFRTSSPQPSTYESHHDPNSALAHDLAHRDREHSAALTTRDPVVLGSTPPRAQAYPQPQAPPQAPALAADHRQRRMSVAELRQAPHHPSAGPSAGMHLVHSVSGRPVHSGHHPQQANPHHEPSHREPPHREPPHREPREPIHQMVLRQGGMGQQGAPNPTHPQGPLHVQPMMTGSLRQGNMGIPGHARVPVDMPQQVPLVTVPHDPYPIDGMTMLCRTGPAVERGSNPQLPAPRPSSRDSESDLEPTPVSSPGVASGQVSPTKTEPSVTSPVQQDTQLVKKKSGFFQNHSPFRRKSMKEVANQFQVAPPRNTWGSDNSNSPTSSPRQSAPTPQASQPPQQQPSQAPVQLQTQPPVQTHTPVLGERGVSPDPIDANASLALNVGRNVFAVTTPDLENRSRQAKSSPAPQEEQDPIALALAELKGVSSGKQASSRVSADRYHGIATPAPATEASPSPTPRFAGAGNLAASEKRGTPPPSYDPTPVSRLGVPPPAVTSRAMKEASKKVADQSRHIFGSVPSGVPSSTPSRPGTRGNDAPRAASPAARRSTSPHPTSFSNEEPPRRPYAPASPAPSSSGGSLRNSAPPNSGGYGAHGINPPPSRQSHYRHQSTHDLVRSASPASYRGDYGGSAGSPGHEMSMQLAHIDDDGYGSQRGRRPGTASSSRPMSSYGGSQMQIGSLRQRSRSVADPSRQYTQDGHPILHFARAMYMYQAAIPEELGFSKGDILAIIGHQDDGWWKAEVHSPNPTGQVGLVPSNYLQPC